MSNGSSGAKKGLSNETTLDDLEQAWRDRESEAATLVEANHTTMSLALRVYALEIRIKTLICKRLALRVLPGHCKTHELPELVIFTGLWSELEDAANEPVRRNWNLLTAFGIERLNNVRYQPATVVMSGVDKFDPAKLIDALDDPTSGVHAWLSRPR